MKKQFLFFAFLFPALLAFAQFPQVPIPGTQLRKITSQIVAGQEYELDIMLPAGFDANKSQKYPVIYLMDSQWDFPLVKSVYGQQYFDGFIPELIVVGVTWGGTNPNPDSLRVRDYTPTNDGRQKQGGHADEFLEFMKKELFPFVEKNYNTDPKNRTLMGCSLGGLFTMYALFTHGDMFNGYVAASPAIGWDREILYQYEEKYAVNRNANPDARLFMTIGGVENNVSNFEKMSDHLMNRAYPNLQMHSKVLENTGHSGTKSETYNRGVQFVYKRPDVKVGETILNKYAGNYEGPNGNKITLKIENYALVIYYGNGNRTVLKAASDTKFYDTSQFFNIEFNDNSGFLMNRYSNTQIFKRVE